MNRPFLRQSNGLVGLRIVASKGRARAGLGAITTALEQRHSKERKVFAIIILHLFCSDKHVRPVSGRSAFSIQSGSERKLALGRKA